MRLKSFLVPIIDDFIPYTPVFTGFGTVDTVEVISRREGDCLRIIAKWGSGTPTTTEARMTLGYRGVSGNVTSAGSPKIIGIKHVGDACFNASTTAQPRVLIEANVTYITFGVQAAGSAGLTKINADSMVAAGNDVGLHCLIPIAGWKANRRLY